MSIYNYNKMNMFNKQNSIFNNKVCNMHSQKIYKNKIEFDNKENVNSTNKFIKNISTDNNISKKSICDNNIKESINNCTKYEDNLNISINTNYTIKIKNNCSSSNNNKTLDNLRILLRFNCGSCNYNFSKITSPYAFSKLCKHCNSISYLVVMRCNKSKLYGGYICIRCSKRFISYFLFETLNYFTPFCKKCSLYTKIYQVLINKSKICIKNIKEFKCDNCKVIRYIPLYNKERVNVLRSINSHGFYIDNPICCNKKMIFNKIKREFKFIELDNNGNSPNYYMSSKYFDNNNNIVKLKNMNFVLY